MKVLTPLDMFAQIQEEVIYEPPSYRNLAQVSSFKSSVRAESFHEQFEEEPEGEVSGVSIMSRVS